MFDPPRIPLQFLLLLISYSHHFVSFPFFSFLEYISIKFRFSITKGSISLCLEIHLEALFEEINFTRVFRPLIGFANVDANRIRSVNLVHNGKWQR